MADSQEFGDVFFDVESSKGCFIYLSHLNNKSSVLCPEKKDVTSQFLALQQVEAHQRMVSRAKSVVDTSAPKSMQSYLSIADRQKKKQWQKSNTLSQPNLLHLNGRSISSRGQTPFSEEDGEASRNASSLNKGVQASISLDSVHSTTADKISWYLEALKHGELYSQPFIGGDHSKNTSSLNKEKPSSSKMQKKVTKGDFMEVHKKCFVQPKKPFNPQILPNYSGKPKLRSMDCYNQSIKNKAASSHSSDTFESYDNEESEDDPPKSSAASSVEEESQIKTSQQAKDRQPNLNRTSLKSSHLQNREYSESSCTPDIQMKFQEDEYLNFLCKVTDHILRSGVYSDKAIKQSFEFHMQFYKEGEYKEKLQSLLKQVLDGLKGSKGDQEETLNLNRNPLLMSLSRPNSPPEKDILENFLSTNSCLSPENELTLPLLQGLNMNPCLSNEINQNSNQNSPPDDRPDEENIS